MPNTKTLNKYTYLHFATWHNCVPSFAEQLESNANVVNNEELQCLFMRKL